MQSQVKVEHKIPSRRTLSEKENVEIMASIPPLNDLMEKVMNRQMIYEMPFQKYEYLCLCWQCLQDLAGMTRTATVALRDAKMEWKRYDVPEPITYSYGPVVNQTRYHLDFCALCIGAASNHLASAAWHLHEGDPIPLGHKYKSMSALVNAWEKRKYNPLSLRLLKQLNDSLSWRATKKYRDEWVHRGTPTIMGERRFARKNIWQDKGDAPPSHYTLKIETKDGKVSYNTSNLVADYGIPDLFDWMTDSITSLNQTAFKFIRLFDHLILTQGCWKFDDDKLIFSVQSKS